MKWALSLLDGISITDSMCPNLTSQVGSHTSTYRKKLIKLITRTVVLIYNLRVAGVTSIVVRFEIYRGSPYFQDLILPALFMSETPSSFIKFNFSFNYFIVTLLRKASLISVSYY